MGSESILGDLRSRLREPQGPSGEGAGSDLTFHCRDRESEVGKE